MLPVVPRQTHRKQGMPASSVLLHTRATCLLTTHLLGAVPRRWLQEGTVIGHRNGYPEDNSIAN